MNVCTAPAHRAAATLQRELDLSRELTAVLGEAASLEDGLGACLARACQETAWELAQAWMRSSPEAQTLRWKGGWASAASLKPFLTSDAELVLDLHADLPGQAFADGAAVWVTDIQASGVTARAAAAAKTGLRSAVAVPVLAGGEPLAALEFFSRERRGRDEETMLLLSEVARQLGPMLRLRRAGEQALQSEEHFRALAETALDAIVSVDRAGRILYLNPSAELMFGYRESEVLGAPLERLISERDRAEHRLQLERVAVGGRAQAGAHPIELRGLRADGEELPMELSLGAHDSEGAVVTAIIRHSTERRRAEERLPRRDTQLGDTQLAKAQALAKLGSWEWDRRTDEETWSEEMFRIYGVPPQHPAPTRYVTRYREPGDRRALLAQWELALREGRPFSVFHRILQPGGRELTLHVQGTPTFDGDGNVVGMVGTTQDLTEQLAAQRSRAHAEERFRQAFEAAPIGMVLARPDGLISRVNEAFCAMTGYSTKDLEHKGLGEFSHPDEMRMSERAVRELLRGEPKSVHLEKRYRHAAGGWIDTRTSLSLVMDAEGEPTLLIAQIEDVTATKRAERALDESRERFQAILDTVPMAVHLKDLDGRYILVNRMAARLAGLEREDLIGKTAAELPSGSPAVDHHAASDRRVIRSKVPLSVEAEVMTPDGARTFLTEKFPVRDGGGTVYGVAAVSLDISDRVRVERENRRLESALQESRRLEAVGGLAGGIAHDFNNLLAVILNYAALAREEAADASPVAEELDEIRRAAERAADLTHKLLVFSRQEQVEPQVLDLNEVVADAEWLLRRTLGEHIELWVEAGEDLWRVEGDRGQLEAILVNLAVNAGHAMPQGGTLSVHTENVTIEGSGSPGTPAGRYVRLSVTDTGSGMPEEVAERAFDPFFTTKPTGEGTGLGLATVQGIARQAGGTVELSSRPGGGTTVTALLPASDGELTPKPPASAVAPPRGEGQAIIVVEDEPSVRRMICQILTRAEYRVQEASPMEALEACARPDKHVDLLLTDVVMPEISGGELAVRARELDPDLKVLFMSGYVDEAKLESGTYELVPLLQKPFPPEELLHSIASTLKQSPRAERCG